MFVDLFFTIAVISILLGVVILILTRRKRGELGLPTGTVIYEDTPERRGHLLYSHTLKLTGKPDALLQQGHMIIPIEVKTGRTPPSPYPNHIMQLVAYCHLVEQAYKVRPTHGIIRYDEKEFTIAYTQELEQQLAFILHEMQDKRSAPDVSRSHMSRAKCAACGFRAVCTERLDREYQPQLL